MKFCNSSYFNYSLFVFLVLSLINSSCSDIKDNDVNDEDKFTRIYDNEFTENLIYPLDIRQTPDGGFIVLNEAEDQQIYLLKVSKTGNVVEQILLTQDYKSPLPLLHANENKYTFFCLSANSEAIAYTFSIDSLEDVTARPLGIFNPLCVAKTFDGFIFQSWNSADNQTVISTIKSNFEIKNSSVFEIKDDVAKEITNHQLRRGERLPFLVGEVENNGYFFNGFFDYNFGVMFMDRTLDELGRVPGYKTQKRVSALYSTGAGQFAIAATEYEKNYFSVGTNLNIKADATLSNITTLKYIPEMSEEIPLIVKQLTLKGKEVIVLGFTTKTNQIALYGYEMESGKMIGKHIIGNTNPFVLPNFTTTSDGGIAIVAKTLINGKMPRIIIQKYSKREFESMFNNW